MRPNLPTMRSELPRNVRFRTFGSMIQRPAAPSPEPSPRQLERGDYCTIVVAVLVSARALIGPVGPRGFEAGPLAPQARNISYRQPPLKTKTRGHTIWTPSGRQRAKSRKEESCWIPLRCPGWLETPGSRLSTSRSRVSKLESAPRGKRKHGTASL